MRRALRPSRGEAPLLLALLVAAGCAHAVRAPERAEDALAAGDRAAHEGRYEAAAADFRAALTADHGLLAAHRGYVEAELRLGRIAEARREYEAQAKLHPGDPVAHYGLGIAAFAAGDAGRALPELEKAADLAPEVAEYWHRLGVAYLASERWVDARGALQKAVAADPGDASIYPAYATALFRTGDRDGAVQALSKLPDLAPTPRDVKQARALVARMNDPFRDFPEALKKDLDQAVDLLQNQDAPQPALEILNEIERRFPDLGVVHALAGLAWQRLDDAGHAIEEFERAEALSPADPLPHLYLGQLYASRERRDRARAELAKALERDPLSAEALKRDAELAWDGGDFAGAAKRNRQLVALDPGDSAARLALARSLVELKDMDGAARELEEVIKRDPKNAEALLRLGLLEADRRASAQTAAERKRHLARAKELLDRVLDLQPDNAAASGALRDLDSSK